MVDYNSTTLCEANNKCSNGVIFRNSLLSCASPAVPLRDQRNCPSLLLNQLLLSRVPIRKVFCIVRLLFAVQLKNEGNRKTPRNKKKRVKKKGQQLKKCKLQLVLKRKSSGSAFVNNCCHAEMQFVAKIQRTYLIRWRWWIRKIVVVEWLLFCCCAQNLIARSLSHWRMVLWNDDKVQSFNAAIYCQMAL